MPASPSIKTSADHRCWFDSFPANSRRAPADPFSPPSAAACRARPRNGRAGRHSHRTFVPNPPSSPRFVARRRPHHADVLQFRDTTADPAALWPRPSGPSARRRLVHLVGALPAAGRRATNRGDDGGFGTNVLWLWRPALPLRGRARHAAALGGEKGSAGARRLLAGKESNQHRWSADVFIEGLAGMNTYVGFARVI